MHYVVSNKNDLNYVICGRLFPTLLLIIPPCPGLFLSDDGDFSQKKTEQVLFKFALSVVLEFSSLLHCPGPLLRLDIIQLLL